MPDGALMRGLRPEVALWRLLALRGIDIPLAQVREDARIDDSLESMQIALSRHSIHARGIRIEGAREIATLETPTLLQHDDGTWILLRACRRGRGAIETADGLSEVALSELYRRLAGQALEITPSLPEGRGLWPRIRQLLSAHRSALLQFAFASLALQSLAMLTPELTGQVMGTALPDSAVGLLRLIATAVVAIAVFTGAVSWLRERIVLYLLTRLELSIKRGFLEHVLHLPFPYLQLRSLGDLLQAFYGIASARSALAERILTAFLDGALAIVLLLMMGIKLLAPTVMLVLIAFVMACAAILIGRVQAHIQDTEVVAQARQRGYLTELISGIRTLKAAGAERECHRRWLKYLDTELALTLRRNRVGLWNEVGIQTLRQAASMALLLWGGYQVLLGDIGIGVLFSFVLLAEVFMVSYQNLLNTYLQLAVVSRQLAPADELLRLDAEDHYAPTSGRLTGPIEMKGIWFRYSSDGPWILKDYDLRVEPGEKHVIRGPSGCGKSTILRLLAGLYTPERGTITIGGRELRSSSVQMLYLPQFVGMNAGTIMDNLRNLSGNASSASLFASASTTGFEAIVATMLMGYQTPIPHGGLSLSGGQRQLLALTAALASGCDLFLFDEPLSNMDGLTQARITAVLANSKCTIISVGHS